jgi:hypothetical protein
MVPRDVDVIDGDTKGSVPLIEKPLAEPPTDEARVAGNKDSGHLFAHQAVDEIERLDLVIDGLVILAASHVDPVARGRMSCVLHAPGGGTKK